MAGDFDKILRDLGVDDTEDALVSAARQYAQPAPVAAPAPTVDYGQVIGALTTRLGEEAAARKADDQSRRWVGWTLAGALAAVLVFLLGRSTAGGRR